MEVKSTISNIRERFENIFVCIQDDILLLAESRQSLEDHVAGLVYLLEYLGFIINEEKSLLQITAIYMYVKR